MLQATVEWHQTADVRNPGGGGGGGGILYEKVGKARRVYKCARDPFRDALSYTMHELCNRNISLGQAKTASRNK